MIASARLASDEAMPTANVLASGADAPSERNAYRAHAVPREDLWRVVESPTTPVKIRVQAARELVLDRHAFDASDDERLHAIAESCAEPTMRATLAQMVSST